MYSAYSKNNQSGIVSTISNEIRERRSHARPLDAAQGDPIPGKGLHRGTGRPFYRRPVTGESVNSFCIEERGRPRRISKNVITKHKMLMYRMMFVIFLIRKSLGASPPRNLFEMMKQRLAEKLKAGAADSKDRFTGSTDADGFDSEEARERTARMERIIAESKAKAQDNQAEADAVDVADEPESIVWDDGKFTLSPLHITDKWTHRGIPILLGRHLLDQQARTKYRIALLHPKAVTEDDEVGEVGEISFTMTKNDDGCYNVLIGALYNFTDLSKRNTYPRLRTVWNGKEYNGPLEPNQVVRGVGKCLMGAAIAVIKHYAKINLITLYAKFSGKRSPAGYYSYQYGFQFCDKEHGVPTLAFEVRASEEEGTHKQLCKTIEGNHHMFLGTYKKNSELIKKDIANRHDLSAEQRDDLSAKVKLLEADARRKLDIFQNKFFFRDVRDNDGNPAGYQLFGRFKRKDIPLCRAPCEHFFEKAFYEKENHHVTLHVPATSPDQADALSHSGCSNGSSSPGSTDELSNGTGN